MKKAMIIVESRAKTQSIGKFVGGDYIVQHCFGHVYDLPENDLGVDVNKDFKPHYVQVKSKQALIKTLQKEAEKVERVILATDPDREGESIAWHLSRLFKGKEIKRMTFNEITAKAVREALGNLTEIDERLVNAQQARRVLDRLVGYKLSPLLWRRVKEGLSAGRVQSVALRLIVDREREIEKFVPVEYWKLTATFSRAEKKSDAFQALLVRLDGKKLMRGNEEKEIKIGGEKEAEELKKKLLKNAYHVESVIKKPKTVYPYPPYITSTLQQDASGRINFSPSRTMTIAQQLYEGIELGHEGTVGLISYMRTDSVRVSDEAIREARSHILEKFGEKYLPQKPVHYKTKSAAQDAHEAIRPTGIARDPSTVAKHLSAEQLKLYTLIWNRFMASQMNPEKLEVVTVDIHNGEAVFRASDPIQLFDGFRLLYKPQAEKENDNNDSNEKEDRLPPLREKEKLNLDDLAPTQHFTKPPPRYSEASIVRTLEEKGIGRPSTYVPTIDTIKKRGYVKMEKRIFHPTQWGFIVTELLSEHFKDIMDYDFTARMEDNLDSIEAGKNEWVEVVRNFYDTFSKELELAVKTMRYEKKVDAACDKCGGQMVLRSGKFGLFYACSKYPECRNTKPFSGMGTTEDMKGAIKTSEPQPTDKKCEKCGSQMLLRDGRYGKFLACSAYPKCTVSRPYIGDFPCPKKDCSGQLTRRFTKKRRAFYGCTRYPDCDFVSWYAPNEAKCPKCGKFTFKKKMKDGYELTCSSAECGHTFAGEAEAEGGKE